MKANVHQCIRTVPVWDPYAPYNLSAWSFGLNVCVTMLGHLVQVRIATTGILLKLVNATESHVAVLGGMCTAENVSAKPAQGES